jgi:hypothetical protein
MLSTKCLKNVVFIFYCSRFFIYLLVLLIFSFLVYHFLFALNSLFITIHFNFFHSIYRSMIILIHFCSFYLFYSLTPFG